jgi:hypothetical protein
VAAELRLIALDVLCALCEILDCRDHEIDGYIWVSKSNIGVITEVCDHTESEIFDLRLGKNIDVRKVKEAES